MGVMDKLITYMKLNDSDEDEDYDDGYLDDGDDEEDVPVPRKSFGSKAAIRDDEDEDDEEMPAPKRSAAAKPSNPVSNKVMSMRSGMNSRKAPVGGGGMEVCVIKPNSFEEAREITETLLKNRTIVMNLEGLDVDVAQRILDFTSGSCFAIGGNLQKISMYIFILTPASVDISGDFQEILGNFDATLHPGL